MQCQRTQACSESTYKDNCPHWAGAGAEDGVELLEVGGTTDGPGTTVFEVAPTTEVAGVEPGTSVRWSSVVTLGGFGTSVPGGTTAKVNTMRSLVYWIEPKSFV